MPSRIISTDTLYFTLFYFVWSLLFLHFERQGSLALANAGPDGKPSRVYLEVITVGNGEDIRSLHIEDLEGLIADGDYVELVAGGQSYFKKVSLTGLLGELDPASFARVHRSAAVNRERVQSVSALPRGVYEITLRSGRKVTSARSYKDTVAGLLPPA